MTGTELLKSNCMTDLYMHSTENLEIAASAQVAITDAVYWNPPLPATAIYGRPFNELTILNDSANDIMIYINGDPTKFYKVKSNSGILEIFKEDKLYFSTFQVKNLSAAAVCVAATITATMRKVY